MQVGLATKICYDENDDYLPDLCELYIAIEDGFSRIVEIQTFLKEVCPKYLIHMPLINQRLREYHQHLEMLTNRWRLMCKGNSKILKESINGLMMCYLRSLPRLQREYEELKVNHPLNSKYMNISFICNCIMNDLPYLKCNPGKLEDFLQAPIDDDIRIWLFKVYICCDRIPAWNKQDLAKLRTHLLTHLNCVQGALCTSLLGRVQTKLDQKTTS